jgi:hypothetical protein
MDQQIFNKTITISEVVMKQTIGGNKYAIKDHEGRTFNFFTTKKDGGDTSVYSQFKNMELAVGSTVMIGYVEDEFEREGKTVISKKIINFRESSDEPTQTAPQGKSFNLGQNFVRSEVSRDEFGRRLAVHGMINGMLASPNFSWESVSEVRENLAFAFSLEDDINRKLAEPITESESEVPLPEDIW